MLEKFLTYESTGASAVGCKYPLPAAVELAGMPKSTLTFLFGEVWLAHLSHVSKDAMINPYQHHTPSVLLLSLLDRMRPIAMNLTAN